VTLDKACRSGKDGRESQEEATNAWAKVFRDQTCESRAEAAKEKANGIFVEFGFFERRKPELNHDYCPLTKTK
jgi:hypothetical protein